MADENNLVSYTDWSSNTKFCPLKMQAFPLHPTGSLICLYWIMCFQVRETSLILIEFQTQEICENGCQPEKVLVTTVNLSSLVLPTTAVIKKKFQ